MTRPPTQRVYVALDTPDAVRALTLSKQLSGVVAGFKVGLELFVSHGPQLVQQLRDEGHSIFLDLKLHDIPNTVAGSAAAVGRLGVDLFTMHALGGKEMLSRGTDTAAEAAVSQGFAPPTSLAVTVLTSHDEADLEQLGLAGPCDAAVIRLAELTKEAGAGGMVCSPLEVAAARKRFPSGTFVVPGIRPAFANVSGDDQSRVATPAGAVADGADFLVVGRPITQAEDPRSAAEAIAKELS